MRLSLIHNSPLEIEKHILFDKPYSTEVEPDISFDEPIITLQYIPLNFPPSKDVVPPNVDSPYSDEIIREAPHPEPMDSSNSPLLTYGVNGVTREFELPNITRIHPYNHVYIQRKLLFHKLLIPLLMMKSSLVLPLN